MAIQLVACRNIQTGRQIFSQSSIAVGLACFCKRKDFCHPRWIGRKAEKEELPSTADVGCTFFETERHWDESKRSNGRRNYVRVKDWAQIAKVPGRRLHIHFGHLASNCFSLNWLLAQRGQSPSEMLRVFLLDWNSKGRIDLGYTWAYIMQNLCRCGPLCLDGFSFSMSRCQPSILQACECTTSKWFTSTFT